MATVYSGWSDTWRPSGSSVDKKYRARLDYSTSYNETTFYCTAITYFNLNSTVTVESSYNSGRMGATSYSETTGSFSTTFNGATTVTAVGSRTFSWARKTSAYTVTVYGIVRSTKKDWDGYSMQASVSLTVPALTSYAVTYNANEGTGAPATQSKYYNVTLTLQSGIPTRTGYTFTNWNTLSNPSETTPGTTYQPGASYTANAAMTLYAQWVPNTYTVVYDKNDINATGTMENSTFTYDTSDDLSLNTFKKKDYLFAGWATTSDGLPQFSDGEEIINIIPSGSTTLYAIWEKQYTQPDIQNPVAYRTSGGTSDDTGTGFYAAIYVTPGIKETSLNVYNVNMPTRVSAYYKLTTDSSWTQIDSDRTTPAMDSWVVTVPSTPYFNVLENTIFTDYIYDIKFVADLIDKALSEDTTVDVNKTYYIYDSVNYEYEEVTPTGTENPSALEWYEDEVKESNTAQTVLPAAKFLIDANPNSDSLALFTTADDEYNSVILGSEGDVKIEYKTNESVGTLDYDIEQALSILSGQGGSLDNVPITYIGGATLGALTATLTTSDWSNNSQTVAVSGVKSNSIVIATPSPASFDDYTVNNVRCAGQSTGELTFTCDFIPDNEIVINIINITIA